MTTAIFTDDAFARHVTPPGHPERVARIERVWQVLDEIDGLDRRAAPRAAESEVLRVHPQEYLRQIEEAIPDTGYVSLDADTHVSPGSLDAALHGVGGNVAAVDAVLAGEAANAFVATRPPGHHAERSTPMGFCLFGNVAVAAKRALDHHGLERVAIVDFDVHHGNGTQDLLWDEPRTLFVSSHQSPLWPGTGAPHETGAHDNVINAPLAPLTDGAAMRTLYEREILPAVADFAPQLLLISAGFDAHADDPLANLLWEVADFAWLTERLCELADQSAGGRVVSTLEGGYDLDALGASVAAHVAVLKERAK